MSRRTACRQRARRRRGGAHGSDERRERARPVKFVSARSAASRRVVTPSIVMTKDSGGKLRLRGTTGSGSDPCAQFRPIRAGRARTCIERRRRTARMERAPSPGTATARSMSRRKTLERHRRATHARAVRASRRTRLLRRLGGFLSAVTAGQSGRHEPGRARARGPPLSSRHYRAQCGPSALGAPLSPPRPGGAFRPPPGHRARREPAQLAPSCARSRVASTQIQNANRRSRRSWRYSTSSIARSSARPCPSFTSSSPACKRAACARRRTTSSHPERTCSRAISRGR